MADRGAVPARGLTRRGAAGLLLAAAAAAAPALARMTPPADETALRAAALYAMSF